MKKIPILLLSFVLNSAYSQTIPVCPSNYYTYVGSAGATSIQVCSNLVPNTTLTTSISYPTTSSLNLVGLAVGRNFSFTAPNPTFWAVGGPTSSTFTTLYYYNGTSFVNTGHYCPLAVNFFGVGSSKNYIYTYNQLNGQILRYNGTGAASLIATVYNQYFGDIVGDDLDNFYLLKQDYMTLFDSTGAGVCAYSVTGIPSSNYPQSFAIVGNTVVASNYTGTYYVGIMANSSINFTTMSVGIAPNQDFASCPVTNTFSTPIVSSTTSTINCFQTLTLTAMPAYTALTYSWSGPGIIGSSINQSVTVNFPGVYSCFIKTGDCPPKVSVATYTVIDGGGFFTPSFITSGSLTCINPTTQVSVQSNLTQHTFTWTGPGILGSANTLSINLNLPGIYSVAATNTLYGCANSGTIYIPSSVGTLSLSSALSSPVLCYPSSGVTLTASGAANYSWSPSSSLNATNGSSVVANPSTTTVYNVIGQTGICFGTTSVTLPFALTPTLFSSPSQSICPGTTATLTANGAIGYSWMPGGQNNQSVSISPSITTMYTVTGVSSGCAASRIITVTVYPSTTLTAAINPTNQCNGQTATLTGSGASSYTWLPGNYTGATVVITPTTSISSYTVLGASPYGCAAVSSVVYMNVYGSVVMSTPVSSTICPGNSVLLTAFPAISPNTFTWLPSGSNAVNITVSPTVSATYTLIGNDGICTFKAYSTVSVSSFPTVTASLSQPSICAGGSVVISPTGAPNPNYTLFIGNGTSLVLVIANQFTIWPQSYNNYQLKGTNGFCWGYNNVFTIPIVSYPTLTLNVFPGAICPGFTSTLIANGAQTYTWIPGGSNGSTLSVSPAASITYSLAGANADCVSTETINVVVYLSPTLAVNSGSLCSGKIFTISPTGASSYTFSSGSATVSPITNTLYTVVGTSSNGCVASNTALSTVNVLPSPSVSIVGNNTVCVGSSVLLTANASINNYIWNTGASSNSIAPSPSTNSVYSVSVSQGNGCFASAIQSVLVLPVPSLSVSASASVICAGQPVTFTGSGASSYSWSGGITNNITFYPTSTTTYTLTGFGTNGCQFRVNKIINVNPLPLLSLNMTPTSSVVCNGSPLNVIVSGAQSFTWSTGEQNAIIFFTASMNPPSRYYVIGTDINNCISDTTWVPLNVIDCSGIRNTAKSLDQIRVFPNPLTGEFVVNVVSPFKKGNFEIYDSLGELVLKRDILESTFQVDLSKLSNGIFYLVTINEEQLRQTTKIIKQ